MKELEHRWIDLFQKGDPEGFEAVYDAYSDSMYRMCYRLSGNRVEAEDLTQEAFVAAYKSRERFEGRSSLRTWLYRIALDCCRSHFRRKNINTVQLIDADLAVSEDHARNSIVSISLERALRELPENLRESLLLVKIEGLKYREAAEVLGVPMGTVQFWVHDGIQRLRPLLSESETAGNL